MQAPIFINNYENDGYQVIEAKQNSKILFKEKVQVAYLVELFLLNNKQGKNFNILDRIKLTLFWNGNMTVTKGDSKLVLLVKGQNRVTLREFAGKSIIINSRTFHCDQNVTTQSLLFQHRQISKKIISNEQIKPSESDNENEGGQVGRFKVTQGSTLKIKNLKIQDSKLILDKEARICLFPSNEPTILDLRKATLYMKPNSKIYSENHLIISAQQICNRGIIKCLQNHPLVIYCKKLQNYGLITPKNLSIRCNRLSNMKFGKIQNSWGKIIIEHRFENLGSIAVEEFEVLGVNGGHMRNHNSLEARKVSVRTRQIQNTNTIVGLQIKLQGDREDSSIFKNQGKIYPIKTLVIRNTLLMNMNDGVIFSNGQLYLEVDAYINQGSLNSNKSAKIHSKGIITNKGTMLFQAPSTITGNDFFNRKQLHAHQSLSVKVNDLFLNTQKTILKDAQISANTILSNDLYLAGKNKMNSKHLFLEGSLVCDNLDIETIHLALNNSGNIQAKNLYIEARDFSNKLKNVKIQNFSFKGLSFQNRALFVIDNSGQILLDNDFSDSSDATTILNNTTIRSGPVMKTNGKVYLNNVVFQGIQDFSNSKELSLENCDLGLHNFSHQKLTLKNAHITTNFYEGNQIHVKGGSTGIHQREKGKQINYGENQFACSVQTLDFLQDVKIYMEDSSHFKQMITSDYDGYLFLDQPLVFGDFYKTLYCNVFNLPNNTYDQYSKNQAQKQKYRRQLKKASSVIIPKGNEKGLIIDARQTDLKFRVNVKYEGEFLTFKSKNIQIAQGKVQMNESGILRLQAQETLKLTEAYLQAKGIELEATSISDKASKYKAGIQGIWMDAKNIISEPKIQKISKSGWSGDSKWRIRRQIAKQSQFLSEGDIIVNAEQFIHLISPHLQAKQDIRFNSSKILIHGVFLLNDKKTTVKKSGLFGSKTNHYYNRNDKPLPAKIQAQNIYLEGKQAKINATFHGKKLYDLTEEGVHLFYIVGVKQRYENRQFSNVATQGVEGSSHKYQKILRTDLTNLKQIERPSELQGPMKFDGVKWDKQKTEIKGVFENKIRKAKSWHQNWCHESISPAASAIISIAASFVGANVIAPYFITNTMSTMQIAMTKAVFSTLTSRFSTQLVANKGNLLNAFEKFFGTDTIRALAFNLATTGITPIICNELKIPKLMSGTHSKPQLLNIFSQNLVKHAISVPLSAVIYGEFPKNLSAFIKPFVLDVFGQYSAATVGHKYISKKIDSLTHKALHGVIGAIGGYIMDGSLRGACAGAISAVASEIALEAMISEEKKQRDIIKMVEEKGFIDSSEIIQVFSKEAALAKIIGISIGGLSAGNWSVSKEMAVNAVENNSILHIVVRGLKIVGKYLLVNQLKKKLSDFVMGLKEKAMQQVEEMCNLTEDQKKQCRYIISMAKDLKNHTLERYTKIKTVGIIDLSQGKNYEQRCQDYYKFIKNFKFTKQKLAYLGPFFVQMNFNLLDSKVTKPTNILDLKNNYLTTNIVKLSQEGKEKMKKHEKEERIRQAQKKKWVDYLQRLEEEQTKRMANYYLQRLRKQREQDSIAYMKQPERYKEAIKFIQNPEKSIQRLQDKVIKMKK